jgi:hypothetical protein
MNLLTRKNPVITIEDESADIIEDESIDPKNPVITIKDESVDIIDDEPIEPKKIIHPFNPEMRRIVLY